MTEPNRRFPALPLTNHPTVLRDRRFFLLECTTKTQRRQRAGKNEQGSILLCVLCVFVVIAEENFMPGPAAILRELHRLHRHAEDLRTQINRGPQTVKAHQDKTAKQE